MFKFSIGTRQMCWSYGDAIQTYMFHRIYSMHKYDGPTHFHRTLHSHSRSRALFMCFTDQWSIQMLRVSRYTMHPMRILHSQLK